MLYPLQITFTAQAGPPVKLEPESIPATPTVSNTPRNNSRLLVKTLKLQLKVLLTIRLLCCLTTVYRSSLYAACVGIRCATSCCNDYTKCSVRLCFPYSKHSVVYLGLCRFHGYFMLICVYFVFDNVDQCAF